MHVDPVAPDELVRLEECGPLGGRAAHGEDLAAEIDLEGGPLDPQPLRRGHGHGTLDVRKTRVVAEQQARPAAAAEGHRRFRKREHAAGRDGAIGGLKHRRRVRVLDHEAEGVVGKHFSQLGRWAVVRQEVDGRSHQVGRGLAERVEHVHEPDHRERGGPDVAGRPEARDGLFVRGGRFPVTITKQQRLGPAGEDTEPSAVICTRELEGACEVALGGSDVQTERPLAGSAESFDRRPDQ